ncbi:MAG: hypothetical protein AAFQ91_29340 [Cyanobacteria bacterium J06621_15]
MSDVQQQINSTFIESIGTLTAQIKQLQQQLQQQQEAATQAINELTQKVNNQQQEIKKLNDRVKAVNAARILGDEAPDEVILENAELLKDCAWTVDEGHRAYACIIGLVDDWKPLFKKRVWGYLNEQDKGRIKQIKAEYEQYQQQIIDYENHQQNLNNVASTSNKSFDAPATSTPAENKGVIDWNKVRQHVNKQAQNDAKQKTGFGAVKVESSPKQPSPVQKTIGFGAVKTVSATEAIDGFGAA